MGISERAIGSEKHVLPPSYAQTEPMDNADSSHRHEAYGLLVEKSLQLTLIDSAWLQTSPMEEHLEYGYVTDKVTPGGVVGVNLM